MNFSLSTRILPLSLNQVFSQIIIDLPIKEEFNQRYIQAHQSGIPRAEQQAAYDTLLSTQWTWPEFDKWREVFLENNQFPYLWKKERLHEMPTGNDRQQEYLQIRILRILVHTISMRAYALRDEQEKVENGMTQRFAECSDGVCPVEDDISRQFNAGELQGLPPFFPGDRTSLVDEDYMAILKDYEKR